MNEAETRAGHIDPALKAAGWGVADRSRVLREYPITLGSVTGSSCTSPVPPASSIPAQICYRQSVVMCVEEMIAAENTGSSRRDHSASARSSAILQFRGSRTPARGRNSPASTRRAVLQFRGAEVYLRHKEVLPGASPLALVRPREVLAFSESLFQGRNSQSTFSARKSQKTKGRPHTRAERPGACQFEPTTMLLGSSTRNSQSSRNTRKLQKTKGDVPAYPERPGASEIAQFAAPRRSPQSTSRALAWIVS